MTNLSMQTSKKLRFRVIDAQGKEMIKTYNKRVALAYAAILEGFVLNVR